MNIDIYHDGTRAPDVPFNMPPRAYTPYERHPRCRYLHFFDRQFSKNIRRSHWWLSRRKQRVTATIGLYLVQHLYNILLVSPEFPFILPSQRQILSRWRLCRSKTEWRCSKPEEMMKTRFLPRALGSDRRLLPARVLKDRIPPAVLLLGSLS